MATNAEKYAREREYQREYRRRPEVLKRDSERRKRLRSDPVYRETYNARKQARRKKAHHYIRNRVAKGTLQRQPCVFCGKPDGHAHHEDYSKPLDIVWVCQTHHSEIHAGLLKVRPEQIVTIPKRIKPRWR